MKVVILFLFLFVCSNARQIKMLRNETSEEFQNEYSNRIAFGEYGNLTFLLIRLQFKI
jgi:hypothetical protein